MKSLTFGALIIVSSILCFSGCASGHKSAPPLATQNSLPAANSQLTQQENPPVSSQSFPQFPAQPGWEQSTANPDAIAPGFEVELKNSDDANINGEFRVERDGILKLPYQVQINAKGSTPVELSSQINREYAKFLRAPKIQVRVTKKEYWVDVKGLVKKPGVYLLSKEAGLDEAISQAGGLQESSQPNNAPHYARIDQNGTVQTVRLQDYYSGRPDLVPHWQGGETIFFQSERGNTTGSGGQRNFVQLLGQVRSPGEYNYQDGAGIYDYLIEAGGPTDRADLNNLTLVRTGASGQQTTRFQLDDQTTVPALQSGDTVIINADNPSSLEKDTRIVGGFASVLSALGAIALIAVAI